MFYIIYQNLNKKIFGSDLVNLKTHEHIDSYAFKLCSHFSAQYDALQLQLKNPLKSMVDSRSCNYNYRAYGSCSHRRNLLLFYSYCF